jgi:hypothetical protein
MSSDAVGGKASSGSTHSSESKPNQSSLSGALRISDERDGFHRPVDVQFDCLPLRSVTRLDPPLDASPGLVAKWSRIKQAIDTHGTHNAYYLHNAFCRFYVTNNPSAGMIAFRFEGVLFTDATDTRAVNTKLNVTLDQENVSWLEQHVVKWFAETVSQAVIEEFNRFISHGDSEQTKRRLEKLEQSLQQSGGYLGMGL